MKFNALAKGRTDLAEVAHRLLDVLFPVHSHKGRGATPSHSTLRGHTEHFPTGKAGYGWLVEQFGLFKPSIFSEYEDFHWKRKSSGCRLARTPQGLFPQGSKRSQDSNNYAAVGGGWYADANLNHRDKFALLLQLGHLASLEYQTDWNFVIEGSTEELADLQRAVVRGKEILKELLARDA